MNPIIGEAFVAIRPDTRGFERDAQTQIGSPLKKIAVAAAASFAAIKVKDFLGGAVNAARESNKIAAQTAAAIKSTGGAAKVTADQIGDLASAISRKTAVDDEAIQSGANLLLTFTRVRNEAGKGNDVFNQATAAIVDMAAAMGTDVTSAALQVGKALNDPIAGLTALGRAGVQFTDQQKEQIKALVASGDALGAQKIILAELTTQFGGSAKAQATAADRLKVSMGNLQESIGRLLIPALDKLSTVLAGVADWLTKLSPEVKVAIGVVAALAAGVIAVNVAVGAYGAVVTAATAVTKVWAAAQWLLNAALSANPVSLVIIAIAALAAGIFVAYQRSETFRNGVQAVWNVLKPLAEFIGGAAVASFRVFQIQVQFVIDVIQRLIDWLKKLPGFIDKALGPLDELIGKAGGVVGNIGGAVGGVAKKLDPRNFFAEGGMVPGPIGMPQLAVVHGGEQVLTPQQQLDRSVHIDAVYVNGRADGGRLGFDIMRGVDDALWLAGV